MYIHTMEEKLPAREMLTHFIEELQTSSYQRQVVSENYSLRKYQRTATGMQTITMDLPFTQISTNWIEDMSERAQLFIIRKVIPGVRMYNLLWHYSTPKKTSEKLAIKELVDKQILFRTEVPGIYLLNPIKVWRGTIFGALEATRRLLFTHRKPSLDIITDLKAPRNEERTGEEEMMLMNSNGITPKLLK
jgi:hypothetical protein